MHKHIALIIVALGAGASGCSNNAAAQTPSGPTRTLTADTDINQLVGDQVTVPGITGNTAARYQKLIDGPFVLTDFVFTSGGPPSLYALPSGQDCAIPAVYMLNGTNGRYVSGPPTSGAPTSGARLVIKIGEELCATWVDAPNLTGVSWSGFRPYQ